MQEMSSDLITITNASRFCPGSNVQDRSKRTAVRIEDYRKLLSEMRIRPPFQRAFRKKLLKRAVLSRATYDFPVPNLAALHLVNHT
jgi:hypothetical protein